MAKDIGNSCKSIPFIIFDDFGPWDFSGSSPCYLILQRSCEVLFKFLQNILFLCWEAYLSITSLYNPEPLGNLLRLSPAVPGYTGICSVITSSAGKTDLSGLAFVAFMTEFWTLKYIYFKKEAKLWSYPPTDNLIYQNFKGKKLILEVTVGAMWLYQMIDVALFL